MFEPEHKSKWFLLLVFGVAMLVGWSVYNQYKPYLIQASCSEIAATSSNLIYKRNDILESNHSYEYVKSKCIQDSGL